MDNQATIGGRVFSFGMLTATDAIRVEVAIARVIGEPLFKAFMDANDKAPAALLAPAEDEGDDAEADKVRKDKVFESMMQSASSAIGLLTSKMNSDELLETMELVFKTVNCDGKKIVIDSTFAGRHRDLWQVFIAALRFNFSDFFTGGLFASIPGKVKKSK